MLIQPRHICHWGWGCWNSLIPASRHFSRSSRLIRMSRGCQQRAGAGDVNATHPRREALAVALELYNAIKYDSCPGVYHCLH